MPLILAVDDSPSMRKMVSFTLTGAGYQVVEPWMARMPMKKPRPSHLIWCWTDQNMPRLDGLGLTRKLREHPQFKTTPILVLTTESSDLMKQAGRAAGPRVGWSNRLTLPDCWTSSKKSSSNACPLSGVSNTGVSHG